MGIVILLVSVSAFLYAVTNVVDKTLISRTITNPFVLTSIGSVVYLAYGVITLAVVPPLRTAHLWLPILAAFFVFVAILLYYRSLQTDEASRVVPLFGFVTLCSVVLGAAVFGETFTVHTYVGIGLLIVGSWMITVRQGVRSPFRSPALGLMFLSSLFWSLRFVIDKQLLAEYPPATVVTYQLVFQGALGVCLLPLVWERVRTLWHRARPSIVVTWMNEGIAIVALGTYTIALNLWYFSLASALASVQYLFLFLLTLAVHRFRPTLIGETITRGILLQKFVAIVAIIGGIVLLSL